MQPGIWKLARHVQVIGLAWLGSGAWAATGGPGDPVAEFRGRDPWMRAPNIMSPGEEVRALARTTDGGWLVAGTLRGSGLEQTPAGWWRLDAAGRILAPGPDALTLNSQVTTLGLLPDGRLLLGGSMRLNPARHRPRLRSLIRLLPSGRLDPAFAGASELWFEGTILTLGVDREGRVLVGGDFQSVRHAGRSFPAGGLLRLNSDGSPDVTWSTPLSEGTAVVRRLVPATGGGFWVAGDFTAGNGRRHLIRLSAEGELDAGFDASGSVTRPVYDVAETGDGALWVADGELGRILPDGRSDPDFPVRVSVQGSLGGRVLLSEGEAVWVGGRFSRIGGQLRTNLALVDRHGQVAPGTPPAALTEFTDDPPAQIHALAHGEEGTLVVGGRFRRLNGTGRPGIGWLGRNGTVDVDRLRTGLAPNNVPAAVVALPDGGLLLNGFFLECHGHRRYGLLGLRADGGVEVRFDSARGLDQSDSVAIRHVVVEPDGALVVAGRPAGTGQGEHTLLRLRPDGSLDPDFGPDGRATSLAGTAAELSALARQPDGALLVLGRLRNWGLPAEHGLYRLWPDGRPDPRFLAELPSLPPGVPDQPLAALAVEPDGAILVGGAGRLARLAPDGRRLADLTAANPSLRQSRITRLLPRADGTVVAEWSHLALRDVRTGRLLADGRPDPAFLAQPLRLYGVWPDGRLLLGTEAGLPPAQLMRAFPNGRLDGSFSLSWSNATLRSATLLADGSVAALLLIGSRPELVRLRGDAPSVSRFTPRAKGGFQLEVSGPPAAEMVLEASPDLRSWTEVRRGRLPPGGHDTWFIGGSPLPDGPAAFFRARPAAP